MSTGVCLRVCGCAFRVCACGCVFQVCVRVCVFGVCACVCAPLCVPCFQAHFRAGRGKRGGERGRRQTTQLHVWAGRPRPFPTNQMQVSINSINGQCLLAIKIAQRLLVSSSKMDDQWPQRSQRSKMTITLKHSLCWPPAPASGGWGACCQPSAARPLSAPLPARPSSRQMAPGHYGLCHPSAHSPKP